MVTQATNVPRYIIEADPAALLCHIRQSTEAVSQGSSTIDRRLAVVVFGPERSGKSSLVDALVGSKDTKKNLKEVGVRVRERGGWVQ